MRFLKVSYGPASRTKLCSMMYGTYISVDKPEPRNLRKLPQVLLAVLAVVVCVALLTSHFDSHPTALERRPRPLNFFTRDELQEINHKLLPTMHLTASARKSRLSWRIENHPDPMQHKDLPLLAAVDLPAKPTTVPYNKPLIGDFDGDTAPSVGDPLGVKLPTQLTEVLFRRVFHHHRFTHRFFLLIFPAYASSISTKTHIRNCAAGWSREARLLLHPPRSAETKRR
jgi:hypothetical protein